MFMFALAPAKLTRPKSMLGYAWAFVPPIFTSLIWIFLQSQKVLGVGDTGMPYVVFVITGTVLWQTFVEALNSPLQMVNSSNSMLTKINFPREALILAGVGQVLLNARCGMACRTFQLKCSGARAITTSCARTSSGPLTMFHSN